MERKEMTNIKTCDSPSSLFIQPLFIRQLCFHFLNEELLFTRSQHKINPIKKPTRNFLTLKSRLLNFYYHAANYVTESQRRMSKSNKLRVLLVEDNRMIQMVHYRLLERFGCHVDLAKNGQQALDMVSHCHDLIFMDIGLPDISGIEVTAEIRRREGNNRRTRIVALTALLEQEIHEACLAAGMDGVETKPIAFDKLAFIINDN